MNREDVHACWAPADGEWSNWVKPVLFACMDEHIEPRPRLEKLDWLKRDVITPLAAARRKGSVVKRLEDVAVVIDVPGEMGAWIGVGLVDYGFRPIPLYNAVQWDECIVDLQPIINVLVDAAGHVSTAPPSGPPVFLLDGQRMSGGDRIKPGVFDNRSVCHQSDFPSVEVLWQKGIRRALLIQEKDDRPAPDLEPILLGWQRRGIALWRKVTGDSKAAAPFTVELRPWLLRIVHAARRSLLRRGSDDAYGMFVPEPGSG